MSTGLFQMNDVVIRQDLWVPITIRVAWDLYMAKVEIRPNVLAAAQIHVLSHLDSTVDVDRAERLTGLYTQDFIRRVKHQIYEQPQWDVDFEEPLSVEYRTFLLAKEDRLVHRVFWLHFSDGLPLKKVAKKISKPLRTAEGICSRLRKKMRGFGKKQGLDMQEWSDVRIDRALSFVGTLATGAELNLDELGTTQGKRYTRKCPRLRRAHYLLRRGVLSERDLEVPEGHEFVSRMKMLALRLHPDAKKYASIIESHLGDLAISIDSQRSAWLIDAEDIDSVEDILVNLAQQGTPERQYLRGAMVVGPGDWYENTMLGPLPMRCLDAVRSKMWGSIDGLDELPLPLPPPPKATQWWIAAAVSSLLSISSLAWALDTSGPQADFPLNVEFDSHIDFVDARFDVSDQAYVSIVRFNGGILQLDEVYTPITKGRLATGDGRFILRVDAPYIAVISSTGTLDNLSALLQAAQVDSDPLSALQTQLLNAYPKADVIVSPPTAQAF